LLLGAAVVTHQDKHVNIQPKSHCSTIIVYILSLPKQIYADHLKFSNYKQDTVKLNIIEDKKKTKRNKLGMLFKKGHCCASFGRLDAWIPRLASRWKDSR
jgi:hypothetical protein